MMRLPLEAERKKIIGELIVNINSLKTRGQWVRHYDRTAPKSFRNPYFSKRIPFYQQQYTQPPMLYQMP